ncbi:hypothetical protein [Sporosarcina sp. FSL K6-1508]
MDPNQEDGHDINIGPHRLSVGCDGLAGHGELLGTRITTPALCAYFRE